MPGGLHLPRLTHHHEYSRPSSRRRTRALSGAGPRPAAERRALDPSAPHPAALRIVARTLLFAARRRGDGAAAPAVRLRNAHLRSVGPAATRPDRRRRSYIVGIFLFVILAAFKVLPVLWC